MTSLRKSLLLFRRKPLAMYCTAVFALAAPDAFASTWTVTTCNDHGAGSLRDVIANPSTVSGDTVDLSKLKTNYGCASSVISLTTGAITITQNTLLLSGPDDRIAITGYYNGSFENDRVFKHTGTGALSLTNLNIDYNYFSPATGVARGGCIYSAGSVLLNHALVLACLAQGVSGNEAFGGGIYAKGDISAKYSQIVANQAKGSPGFGGGAFARGQFSADHSTINGNYAATGAGAIYATSGASIANSTISGNTAISVAGAMTINGTPATDSLTITNSTISGNRSLGASMTYVGGVFSFVPTTVQNSTIAFNTATSGTNSLGQSLAPGLAVLASGSPAANIAVNLESSILSNNTYGSTEGDFSALAKNGNTITITSNNNIIRASLGSLRPTTITTNCPLLGPLRDNGGLTQTHALLSRSPAIDTGNNSANLIGDQRGATYPRVSGPSADIGAYEVQQPDIVFNNSFEGCPILF